MNDTCDICGYKNSDGITVFERADGIVRCNSCANRSLLPGAKFVTDSQALHLYERGHRFPWETRDCIKTYQRSS